MKILNIKFVLTLFCVLVGIYNSQKLLAESSREILVSNPKFNSNSNSNNNQLIIDSKEFGVRITNSEGGFNFFPTNTVPLKPGDAYGWRMKVNNYQRKNGKIKLREVLRLPSHPEMWKTENSDKFYISKDGKVATSIKMEMPVNGIIQNFWTITPGDPLGKYQVEVYLNDRLVEVFKFQVVPF